MRAQVSVIQTHTVFGGSWGLKIIGLPRSKNVMRGLDRIAFFFLTSWLLSRIE